MATTLNIVTYNLHGLAQGGSLLSDLSKSADIIFVQEHWLPTFCLDNLYRITNNMLCYASSAMDDIVSAGVLRGRPFGGVAIFVKNNICRGVKLICKASRYIIVQMGDLVLCNVYLPCPGSVTWEDDYVNCLASIANDLSRLNFKNLIFGGDFNIDFARVHPLRSVVLDFLKDFKLRLTDDLLPSNSATFRVEASGASSFIDHFAVTQPLYDSIMYSVIIDNGANLSDHCALRISVEAGIEYSSPVNSSHFGQAGVTSFRWDRADLSAYYSISGQMLNNVDVPKDLLSTDSGGVIDTQILSVIDNFYHSIVSCLFNASVITIPQRKHNFYKFWWDEELSLLKDNSISTHRLWVSVGRPRSGEIFHNMQHAKYEYKSAIRSREKERRDQFSDELNDALATKDMNSFWRSWQSKFSKKKVSSVIDGVCDPAVIAGSFADMFQAACVPNSIYTQQLLKNDFNREFDKYDCESSGIVDIDVEMVDRCFKKLKRGKAAGRDGLMPEHLLYAHPTAVTLLTHLFQLIIRFGVVPTDFGCGIIIPLVKNHDGDVTSSDNYRGITLSPVISKVFELVLMEVFGDKLTSSPLQFGFKPKSSCNHALFTLRMVVKHYCSSGNTLTLCALDISKAFDRVNFYGLMNALMARHFPKCFVSIILDWLHKCVGIVRWANCFSAAFAITAGVRQGGLLSPALFAIYIDNLISRLKASKLGCHVNGVYYGCLVYADDIMLLSHSVQVMQYMLDICESYATDFDVKFNCIKSVAMRIGWRHNCSCADLILCGKPLLYVASIKYLGVYINSAKSFKCSFEHVKMKFYRTFNALYCRSKASYSELVSIELFKSYCLPSLLYAVESVAPSKTDVRMMDRCIDAAVRKIFKVSTSDNCSFIRSCLGLPDISILVKKRTVNFITGLHEQRFPDELLQLCYNELFTFGSL